MRVFPWGSPTTPVFMMPLYGNATHTLGKLLKETPPRVTRIEHSTSFVDDQTVYCQVQVESCFEGGFNGLGRSSTTRSWIIFGRKWDQIRSPSTVASSSAGPPPPALCTYAHGMQRYRAMPLCACSQRLLRLFKGARHVRVSANFIMDKRFMFKDQQALKRFQCSLCRKLLREAVQPTCGHRLCQCCADQIVEKKRPPQCPQDDCDEYFLTFKSGYYVSLFFNRNCVQRSVLGVGVALSPGTREGPCIHTVCAYFFFFFSVNTGNLDSTVKYVVYCSKLRS